MRSEALQRLSTIIKTFADGETQRVYTEGQSRRLPPDLIQRAVRRLGQPCIEVQEK